MSKKNKNEKKPTEVIEDEDFDLLGIFAENNVEISTRPSKVRIFGKDYVINYVSPHLGMEDYGKIEFNLALINIQDFQLPLAEADTVLHEVIHGIDDVMDLKLTEHQVLTLTTGIMGVFQDNPEFAEYIIRQRPLPTND